MPPSTSIPTSSTPTTPASSSHAVNINKKPARAPTAFEKRVYDAISAIPKGKVSTYGEVAKVLGSSPRAVGGALRRNPFAPRVPCHRVVAAGGAALGGFSGTWGATPETARKLRMLLEEGVEVVRKKKEEKEKEGVEFLRSAVMSAAELAEALKRANSSSSTAKKAKE